MKLKNNLRRLGFTLIELLVVISIIAILAGISLPVYTSVQKQGKMTQTASDLHQLNLAMLAYLNDNEDRMPVGPFVVIAGNFDKYVTNPKALHSAFDPRVDQSGDAAPISMGFNPKVLSPDPNAPSSGSTWNGNISTIEGKVMKGLIFGAPNFSGADGMPENVKAWGDDKTNTAKTGNTLPLNGAGMSSKGLYSKRTVVMFYDHVETVKMSAFQGTSADPNDNLYWDPLKVLP